MEKDKLKPCPFCGYEADYIMVREQLFEGSDWKDRHFVSCKNFFPCNAKVGWFDTKEEAIKAWDKRA